VWSNFYSNVACFVERLQVAESVIVGFDVFIVLLLVLDVVHY